MLIILGEPGKPDDSMDIRERYYITFDMIQEYLGHQGRLVHYLKIDIEYHEWKVRFDTSNAGQGAKRN